VQNAECKKSKQGLRLVGSTTSTRARPKGMEVARPGFSAFSYHLYSQPKTIDWPWSRKMKHVTCSLKKLGLNRGRGTVSEVPVSVTEPFTTHSFPPSFSILLLLIRHECLRNRIRKCYSSVQAISASKSCTSSPRIFDSASPSLHSMLRATTSLGASSVRKRPSFQGLSIPDYSKCQGRYH
jgi:hypothetical protein